MKLLGIFLVILAVHSISGSPLLGGLLNGLTSTLGSTTKSLTKVVSSLGQDLGSSLSVLGGVLSNVGKILTNLLEAVGKALGSLCTARNRGSLCHCSHRSGNVIKSLKSLRGNADQNLKTLSSAVSQNFAILSDIVSGLGELDNISATINGLLAALEGSLNVVLKCNSKTPKATINQNFAAVVYGVAVLTDAIDSISSVAAFISATLTEAVANAVAALTVVLSAVTVLVETVLATVAACLGRAVTSQASDIVIAVSEGAQLVSALINSIAISTAGTVSLLPQITAVLSAVTASITSSVGEYIDVVPGVTGAISGLASSLQLILGNLCSSLDPVIAAEQYRKTILSKISLSALRRLEDKARSRLSLALRASAKSLIDIGDVINGIAGSGRGILRNVARTLQDVLDIFGNISDALDIKSISLTVAKAFEIVFLAIASLTDSLSNDVTEPCAKALFTLDNALSELLLITSSLTCGDDISTIIDFAATNVAGSLNAFLTIIAVTIENAATVVGKIKDESLASALAALSLIVSTTLAISEGIVIIVAATLEAISGRVPSAIDTLLEAVEEAVDDIADAISNILRNRGSTCNCIPKLSVNITKILGDVVDTVRSLTGDTLKIGGSCTKAIQPFVTAVSQ